MCINSGCGFPDGGDPPFITDKTFEEAAKAAGQSVEETKKSVYEYLKKDLEKKIAFAFKAPLCLPSKSKSFPLTRTCLSRAENLNECLKVDIETRHRGEVC